MAWRIEVSDAARKGLDGLDRQIAIRILRFLHDRIARLDDPRSVAEALRGLVLGRFWRYRVGDHRIVVEIRDDVLLILVVSIGNRKDVYRR